MIKQQNKIYPFTILSILFILFSNLPAQNNTINFQHLSLEDGLSHSTINCIFQDSRGFLWFGTDDGLNRYDGYNFKIFLNDPEKPGTISSNRIRGICEDEDGNLWIGTFGGLNTFNIRTGRFASYTFHPDIESRQNIIWSMAINDGFLWVGTESGLIKFNTKSKKYNNYKLNSTQSKFQRKTFITIVYIDNSKKIWIGTKHNGLYTFKETTNSIVPFKYKHSKNPSFRSIRNLFKDQSGILWIGTEYGGLIKYNSQNQEPTFYKHIPGIKGSISSNDIQSIFGTKSGDLWIGTNANGLNKYNSATNSFTLYEHDPKNANSISHNSILSMYEDNSGVLWIGTYAGGINTLNKSKKRFDVLKNEPGNPISLSNSTVFSVYEESNGIIWIGTITGLNRYDSKNNLFKVYSHDKNNPKSISHNVARAIYKDDKGNLWIGTDNGLNKFNREDETFSIYRNAITIKNYSSNWQNIIRSIIADNSGKLWIGTQNGICTFDEKKEQFTYYRYDENNQNSLSSNTVRVLLNDRDGLIWIGTENGLNKFNPETKEFFIYKHNPKNPHSISSDNIYSILEDKKGLIWIGTKKGLNALNRKTGLFTNYTEHDGLGNDIVYCILESNDNNLWLSTDKGITKAYNSLKNIDSSVKDQKLKFRNFDIKDGVQGHEFNSGASFKSNKGTLYFGGMNGLNIFDPEKIMTDNSYIPPVVLTEFRLFSEKISIHSRIDGKTILSKPIELTEKIVLPYNANYISFKFTALDFTCTKNNKFAYMMKGLSNEWHYLGTKNELDFHLSPGTFILNIKGSNSDHVWNENGVSITIIINPPFWTTIWFRIAVSMFVFLVIFSLYRVRIYNIKKKISNSATIMNN